MNNEYLNAIANHGATLVKFIGLVNGSGVEISGGSYVRLPVTWATAVDGTIRPTTDLTFDVPASTSVGGWRGYSAVTAGTEYGGETLTLESFAGAGQYKLIAVGSGILHQSNS